MKKILLSMVFAIISCVTFAQTIYVCKDGEYTTTDIYEGLEISLTEEIDSITFYKPQFVKDEFELQEPVVGMYAVFPSVCSLGQILHGWVYLDYNESSQGCDIKKVDFYWDDNFVTTATSIEHYALDICLSEFYGDEGSIHTVKAVATVGGNGYKDKEVIIERDVEIARVDQSVISVKLLIGEQGIIKNGDKLTVYIWQDSGNQGYSPNKIYVNLYWDDTLVCIGNLTTLGYNIITYEITNASVGAHNLSVYSYIYENDRLVDEYNIEKTITVIE